jgi:hypothetical protein
MSAVRTSKPTNTLLLHSVLPCLPIDAVAYIGDVRCCPVGPTVYK